MLIKLNYAFFARPSKSVKHLNQTSYEVILSFVGKGGSGQVFKTHTFYFDHQQKYQPGKHLRVDKSFSKTVMDEQKEGLVLREFLMTPPHLAPKKTGILNASRALNHQLPMQLVLRYIDGKPLIDIIKNDLVTTSERLTRERRILIARNMLKAVLEQVLTQGRIHRDLTPMNIMIRPNDDVTVFDFGLAQMVDEKRLDCVGTPNYAPVEAFNGEHS